MPTTDEAGGASVINYASRLSEKAQFMIVMGISWLHWKNLTPRCKDAKARRVKKGKPLHPCVFVPLR